MFASMLGIIPYSGVELMVYSYLTVGTGAACVVGSLHAGESAQGSGRRARLRSGVEHVRTDDRLPLPAGENEAAGTGNARPEGAAGKSPLQTVQRSVRLHQEDRAEEGTLRSV